MALDRSAMFPRAGPSTIVLDRRHRVAAVFLTALVETDLLPVVRRLAAEPECDHRSVDHVALCSSPEVACRGWVSSRPR